MKTRRESLLFVLIVCLSYVCLSCASKQLSLDTKINRTIYKHWLNYKNSLPESVKRTLDKAEVDQKPLWLETGSHKCDHDVIANQHYEKMTDSLGNYLRAHTETPIQNTLQARDTQAFGTIRFSVNTSLIDADGRACTSAGSQVGIGDSPSGACKSDGSSTNDCYYTCTTEDVVSPALRNILKTSVVPAVLDVIKSFLEVDRVQGNLLLNDAVWRSFDGQCYYGAPLARSLVRGLGNGLPNTDTLILVTARPSKSKSTVAYALGCNFDWDGSSQTGVFGRPLAGLINFSPRYFQKYTQTSFSLFEFEAAVKVGVHELTHALGFSNFFFKSYIDTRIGRPYNSVTRTETRTGTSPASATFSHRVTKLITPRVVEVARDHYDCPTLNGVELEDYGSEGTAGSHWEQRVVQNEYMAGYVSPYMAVSELTMALFEDMGWYRVDYGQADYWAWGKDQGCGFVNGRCESWSSSNGYMCAQRFTGVNFQCTADRIAKGGCNFATNQGVLDPYYQHFSNPQSGGDGASADYCAFVDHLDNNICLDSENTADTSISEAFGASSLCWEYGKGTSTLATNPPVACWSHACSVSGNNTILQVIIGGTAYNCPTGGGPLQVSASALSGNGVVKCPPVSLVCRRVAVPTGSIDTGTDETVDDQVTSGDDGDDSACWIATAAYGSAMDPHVWKLRLFRDQYLLTNAFGRLFVQFYYACSPPIADFIRQYDLLRWIIRTVLWPVVRVVELLL